MDNKLIKTTLLVGTLLALSCSVQAADKVVVVPLFSASGDATTGDVLAGKTFSNATAKGISGSRSPAPVAATGQSVGDPIATTPGSDGDEGQGISVATRFTDNGDGTVTDNLTGLVWLKDASCLGVAVTWLDALSKANALATGDVDCALSDGSVAGVWRLPNLFELESLRDMSENTPPLTRTTGQDAGYPFTGVKVAGNPESYWTSTTLDGDSTRAWAVEFLDGQPFYFLKGAIYFIWPVRDK